LTLVITRYLRPILFAISATLAGSVGSGGAGLPAGMEQNLQLRVQILPSIRTVAVPLAQHWPRLGQFALLQIVCRWSDFRICSVRRKESPAGKGLLSQEGSLFDLRLI
jgi:hypothetical protein